MTRIDTRVMGSRVTERGVRPDGTGPEHAEARGSAVPSGDRVSLSGAARALSAARGEGENGTADGLTAERVAEIRQRILQGAYDTTVVVEEVARRILASGTV